MPFGRWRAAPRVRCSRPRCAAHVIVACFALILLYCNIPLPSYSSTTALRPLTASARPSQSAAPCMGTTSLHLLHNLTSCDQSQPPRSGAEPVHPAGRCRIRLFRLLPIRAAQHREFQRTARPRGLHALFSAIRQRIFGLYAYTSRSAEAQLQNSPRSRPISRALVIQGYFAAHAILNGTRKKKGTSRVRVSGFDADSGPARAGASAHIPNPLTPIREHIHYHV